MNKYFYLFLLLILVPGKLLFAQVPAWAHGADQNDVSFGFTFQYLSNYFKVTKKPDWRKPYFDAPNSRYITDSLNSITSKNAPGFGVGFIARYRISDHLEVRTTPELVFGSPSLSYAYQTPSQDVTKQVQNTMVDLPLLIKLKSDRIYNFRAYMIGGVKYSQVIGGKKNNPFDDPLNMLVRTSSHYGSYEAGLGCDIYFEYFKLSPEIKISNSFGNVLVSENHPYAAPIEKLSLHTLMLSLYFE
jgi:hypothetical protein